MRTPLAEKPACGVRFPAAFRLPAFASRVVLLPLESSAFLTVGLPSNIGCGDSIGVVTFRMRQKRPGWVPSVPRERWCAPARLDFSGRHLPSSNGRPLFSRWCFPSAKVLMTRRRRGFTRFTRPVFPSLYPPDGTAALGHFLGLRTPRLPATHAEAGTVLTHGTGRYIIDISRSSFDEHRCSQAASCRTTQFNQDPLVGVNTSSMLLATHQVTTSALPWGP